jgi:hypothetical protein
VIILLKLARGTRNLSLGIRIITCRTDAQKQSEHYLSHRQKIIRTLSPTQTHTEIIRTLPATQTYTEIIRTLPASPKHTEIIKALPATKTHTKIIRTLPATQK